MSHEVVLICHGPNQTTSPEKLPISSDATELHSTLGLTLQEQGDDELSLDTLLACEVGKKNCTE